MFVSGATLRVPEPRLVLQHSILLPLSTLFSGGGLPGSNQGQGGSISLLEEAKPSATASAFRVLCGLEVPCQACCSNKQFCGHRGVHTSPLCIPVHAFGPISLFMVPLSLPGGGEEQWSPSPQPPCPASGSSHVSGHAYIPPGAAGSGAVAPPPRVRSQDDAGDLWTLSTPTPSANGQILVVVFVLTQKNT
uniref:Uncharacterized protein n=1 Tax=Myotis myotis TaxID=51298 RepID=A0A7J7XH57_MYOMY|nr:hypothetical protein mMyoMyo1_011618 [Myotis myotis]